MLRSIGVFLLAAGAMRGQSTLTLAEAERIAVQNNPRLSASQFLGKAAGMASLELSSVYQPTLTGSVTGVGADSGSRIAAGGLNNPAVYNRVASGLTASQYITDFGRTRNLIESAKLRAQAQDRLTDYTRADILLQVDRAYFATLRAQAVLRVATETVAARQLVSDQVTALANSQLKSTLDVSFANVNLAEAKLLLSGAQSDLNASMADLANAMGTPVERTIALADASTAANLPATVEPLIEEAIRKRPELANLRLEQNAAERFIQAEKALRNPSVAALATAGFVPVGEAQVPGRYGAAGVNVNIPLFNGGLFRARQSEAEYRSLAAAQNVKDLENRVVRDVQVAYLNAATALERVGLTGQLLRQSQLAFDLAKTRYDLGLSSIVELSQAQLNLTSAQIASETARYDYSSQRSILDFQIGSK